MLFEGFIPSSSARCLVLVTVLRYALFFFLGIASFFLNAKKERSNVRVWVRTVPNTKIFFIPLSEKK